jgi:hypothetical protein
MIAENFLSDEAKEKFAQIKEDDNPVIAQYGYK